MKYYIGQRNNPQLPKPYFVAYGKISKKFAKQAENCVYGSMFLTPYDTEEEYNNQIEKLRDAGFKVSVW